jgi:hypothetical protein
MSRAAAAVLAALLLSVTPVHGAAGGHKPPTHASFASARLTSFVMYSGSCEVRHETDPAPRVTGGLAVWDAEEIVNVPIRLTLRPVLAGGAPTGEFIFSGRVPFSAAGLASPTAGRLIVDAPDCEVLSLGALVQDSAGLLSPYAVHVER